MCLVTRCKESRIGAAPWARRVAVLRLLSECSRHGLAPLKLELTQPLGLFGSKNEPFCPQESGNT